MALSFVRVEADSVIFRRWPRRSVRIPRRGIDRFAVSKKVRDGFPLFYFGPLEWPKETLEYVEAVMSDGSSVRVSKRGSELDRVALQLNNLLLNLP